jgi:hypothetical protein
MGFESGRFGLPGLNRGISFIRFQVKNCFDFENRVEICMTLVAMD